MDINKIKITIKHNKKSHQYKYKNNYHNINLLTINIT